jgi:uncharacterized damage-inducible protein DinB
MRKRAEKRRTEGEAPSRPGPEERRARRRTSRARATRNPVARSIMPLRMAIFARYSGSGRKARAAPRGPAWGGKMEANEVLLALARYKLNVDESVLGIVEKLGEERLTAPSGAYFPTIYDQLKHIFGSDVNWIKRLKPAFPKSAALAASRFAELDLQTLKAPFAEMGAKVFADMRELDRTALAFVAELDDEDLGVSVSYKNYKGEAESRELWKLLLQWFNHGCHHRGTISAQLDALGVENDYSSLLPRI